MALNANWPVVETAWGPAWDAGGGRIPPDRYVEVTAIGTFATGRGRQYQLDQVQAGTSSMTLPNTDGSLDPDNIAGPFAGRILPFQPIRRRAQWPPTINLLTQAQATGGDAGGQPLGDIDASDQGPRILSEVDSIPQFVSSATAWQGATVAQFDVTAAVLAGQWICYTEQPAVKPGQTYTMQLQVRNVTPSTSMQVAAGFRTQTASGATATTVAGTSVTLTGSATAPWTQVTVTATAASNSAWLSIGLQVVTAPGANCQLQIDGWQLEKGSTASAWVQPGTWYPVTSQFAEKWTADWADSGTRGIVQPSGVDALALLSQTTLPDPLTAEIQSHNPRFLYTLDDPQGSQQAADATGNNPPIPVTNGKNGASSITFGTSITASDTVNGIYTGSSGTVARFNNPNVGALVFGPCTYLSLTDAGITGPANPAGAWTRVIAFRYTGPTPSYSAEIWMAADKKRTSGTNGQLAGSSWAIYIGSSGAVQFNMSGPDGTPAIMAPAWNPVVDGNWHLFFVVWDPTTNNMTLRLDESVYFFTLTPSNVPTGLAMDSVGAFVDTQAKYTTSNFGGDISFVAEFPVAFQPTDRNNLYTAWKSACSGESTDARYGRILRYAGYSGASSIDTGQTTSMGPASGIAGQDAVSALQAVVDTEGGAHYVPADGTLTFTSRGRRYNALTPVYTFGERGDLGEWPYEDCKPDFDSTHLGGVVEVTQEATGQVFTAVDDASVTAYFPRTITRTVNASDPYECQDAANYLKSRFAQPSTRLAGLKLHPSAVPALWPVCLSLEQGMRIRVMRRPLGAPAITIDCFVEKLDWSQTDGGDAVLTVQASRADTTTYGIFAAWHTTLHTAIGAGSGAITIDNGQDNTNPLAAQIAPGQQLTLEPGTANAETVTVQSVAATTSGWTTAVITFTTNTTLAHAVNTVVCEVLPAGTTDPTTWDSDVSAFDSHAFAY